MAEESGQEKTEEPSSKRLEDARKKGQVVRSRELNTFVLLILSAFIVQKLGAQMGQDLLEMMRSQFHLSREAIFDPHTPLIHFKRLMFDGALLIAPLLLALLIAAIIAPLALGGWVFSWQSIAPNLEKLDPVKGLARLFAVRGLVELFKALLKFLLIFVVALGLFKHFSHELMKLSAEPLEQAALHGFDLVGLCFLLLSASLVVVAAVDVPYQLWEHNKKLKMTLQEIKDEMKESEGSPEVKGRLRRMQMEMAKNRMMTEVPKADVIVTNPSHYAVALKYEPNSASAPKLVAKGVDLMAAQIRSIAIGAKVPLLASPPLARALYYSTDLNKEIPQGLYLAVAQVLAYVYQLKAARQNHWAEPMPPREIKVPEEFKQGR